MIRKIRAAALSLLFACGLGLAALGQTTVTAQTTLNGGSSSSTAGGLYNQVLSATPTRVSTGLSGWLNQGSATTGDTATGLQVTGVSGQFWQLLTKTPPATPYSITAEIQCFYSANGVNGTSTIGGGIGWTDGTKLHLLALQNATLLVTKFSNFTTFSANDFSNGNFPQYNFQYPNWLKIKDDGTNVVFYFSADGATFQQLFSVAKSAGYLGSSGYSTLVFGTNSNGAAATCTVLSWAQGTS
jgi:hypothetical protein